MAAPRVQHAGLDATFEGLVRHDAAVPVHQFRGIKFARIPGRFELAQPVDSFGGAVVNATSYGPRCPQVPVDVRHLLRIPEDFEIADEPEDEFECLNLDITGPAGVAAGAKLPVLVWIHGGSQIVTFCSAASKICDPTRLVAESVQAGMPMLFVALNYRLNIFSFGDGKEKNLAIKDQRLGIDWVRKHIAEFGGDPDNITLAGESAGAIYVHAQLVTGPPVKRAVLASGTLYLSSPLPGARGEALIQTLEGKVRARGHGSLREAPVAELLRALAESNVNTMWIQEDDELAGWESRIEQVDELMIGDTEYESVIWRNGIELFDGQAIADAFDKAAGPEWGPRLRKMYQVVADRPTAAKLGALDLVNDARYALPVELISHKLQAAGKRVFRYLVDQPNPWQASSRAHHAVDLLFLFGGVDLAFNGAAEAVGREMRRRWALFVTGGGPWPPHRRFVYGPVGESREIDGGDDVLTTSTSASTNNDGQFAARRRVQHLRMLQQAGIGVYLPVVFALTAGRISLLN